MNIGGWISMVLCVGGMTTFFVLCIRKVLSTPKATEHLHSQRDRPPDIEDNGDA